MARIFSNKKELIESVVGKEDVVLDVGFWGQGVRIHDDNWVHNILVRQAKSVYGIDLEYDEKAFSGTGKHKKASAESFSFDVGFDVIFAGDIIEHLSNPGLFLESSLRSLKESGRLVITTPNCFNFFHLTEKIMKPEPTVNSDHTCYFNRKTIKRLLEKNGWEVKSMDFLYSLDVKYRESWKKKILNIAYALLSRMTPKFCVDIVVVAERRRKI